jgi:hypothetical protein
MDPDPDLQPTQCKAGPNEHIEQLQNHSNFNQQIYSPSPESIYHYQHQQIPLQAHVLSSISTSLPIPIPIPIQSISSNQHPLQPIESVQNLSTYTPQSITYPNHQQNDEIHSMKSDGPDPNPSPIPAIVDIDKSSNSNCHPNDSALIIYPFVFVCGQNVVSFRSMMRADVKQVKTLHVTTNETHEDRAAWIICMAAMFIDWLYLCF